MVSVLRGLVVALEVAMSVFASEHSEESLCVALERIADGEVRSISVKGVLLAEPELTVLCDPEDSRCAGRVQAAVWVEFESTPSGALRRILSDSGRAAVILKGELHGPRLASSDVPTLAPSIAAMVRASNRRYGHMGEFRAKFVVEEVVAAFRVDESMPRLYEWRRENESCVPRLLKAPAPMYPELARTAGIAGDVLLHYEVAAGQVVGTKVLFGDRLLAEAAVQYVRELQFTDDASAVLECLFSFQLERRSCQEGLTSHVVLELPTRVKITAARHMW